MCLPLLYDMVLPLVDSHILTTLCVTQVLYKLLSKKSQESSGQYFSLYCTRTLLAFVLIAASPCASVYY